MDGRYTLQLMGFKIFQVQVGDCQEPQVSDEVPVGGQWGLGTPETPQMGTSFCSSRWPSIGVNHGKSHVNGPFLNIHHSYLWLTLVNVGCTCHPSQFFLVPRPRRGVSPVLLRRCLPQTFQADGAPVELIDPQLVDIAMAATYL